MKNDILAVWFTLFIVITFAGCASYTPSLAKLDISGPNVSRQVKGNLTVYVEEYGTPEKCKKTFDTDLAN